MHRFVFMVLLVGSALFAFGCDTAVVSTGAGDAGKPPNTVCTISRCVDGVASRCDGSNALTCSAYGGSCETFQGGTSTYEWCGCSGEGTKTCMDTSRYVECETGQLRVRSCSNGTRCDASGETICVCNDAADGICPGACPNDPDCSSCTPSCTNAQCGDNGCGGQCGTCASTEECSVDRLCLPICTPNCEGKVCGSDGCGGQCGTCPGDQLCSSAGFCLGSGFEPNCNDTCPYANDGECDDGAEGSDFDVCYLGSDCADCGPRAGAPNCIAAATCGLCQALPGCGFCAENGLCMPTTESGDPGYASRCTSDWIRPGAACPAP